MRSTKEICEAEGEEGLETGRSEEGELPENSLSLFDKEAWDDRVLIEAWNRATQYYQEVTPKAIAEGERIDQQLQQQSSVLRSSKNKKSKKRHDDMTEIITEPSTSHIETPHQVC
jgi:hypothetical protein